MSQSKRRSTDDAPEPKRAFLTPREQLQRYWAAPPQQPSAKALAAKASRERFEMTLFADVLRSTNAKLEAPLRARYDTGGSMDIDGGALRPCLQCARHRASAYVTAVSQCAVCHVDLCTACLRRHTAVRGCRAVADAAAIDASTAADSSDDVSDDGSDSSISVE